MKIYPKVEIICKSNSRAKISHLIGQGLSLGRNIEIETISMVKFDLVVQMKLLKDRNIKFPISDKQIYHQLSYTLNYKLWYEVLLTKIVRNMLYIV